MHCQQMCDECKKVVYSVKPRYQKIIRVLQRQHGEIDHARSQQAKFLAQVDFFLAVSLFSQISAFNFGIQF